MSDDFDGKVLNPYGVEITLPFWAFRRLKRLHLVERDRETGKRRIEERMFGLMEIWDDPDGEGARIPGPGPRSETWLVRSIANVVPNQ